MRRETLVVYVTEMATGNIDIIDYEALYEINSERENHCKDISLLDVT